MRILSFLIGMVLLASPSIAQTDGKFEQITVSSTAVGISAATLTNMAGCAIVVESNAIRVRYDGTNPTATVGSPISAGGSLVLRNANDLTKLRMIRQASDATAWVSCWPSPGDGSPVVEGRIGATDPCTTSAKTYLPINIVTATTTEITASLAGAGNHYYICSLNLVTAGANNVALTDDDTDNCGSVTSGLAGGTTAATGWNLGANGGVSVGNGMGTVFKTGGTNRVVCVVTSAAVQLSGAISVVAAP